MSEILETKEAEYIDLIVTEEDDKDVLYVAPPWSCLRKGDRVLAKPIGENDSEMEFVTVKEVLTTKKDGREHEFLKAMLVTFAPTYGKIEVKEYEGVEK